MRLRRLLTLPLVAVFLYTAVDTATSWAEEKKAAPAANPHDVQVFTTLRDVINKGADIYNKGDVLGCYRLYEGALTASKPFLAHHPKLQKAIDDGMAQARTSRDEDKAFVLRSVIDQIRKETNPNPKADVVPPVTPVAKTLWDRLGGEKGVSKVVDDFVALAAPDPKVDFFRGGKYKVNVPDLKKKLIELISAVSGGPLKYTGKSMKESHAGMGITNAQFDAIAKDLADALKKNGVKLEDANAVLDVVEGTRKDIVESAKVAPPMPTTLWDKLGGEKAVSKVVDDFVATAATDPKVDFTRGGKSKVDVPALKKRLVEMISAVTGGPLKYTGKDMKEVHKGMGITDAEFDALAGHLAAAMKKNGVKPEDAKALLDIVGTTRKDIVEAKKPDPTPDPMAKTLWDKLGGEKAVAKVVHDFVVTAAPDPKVDFTRGGKYKPDVPALEKSIVEFVSSATGGPLKYTGKNMKDSHKGMGITDEQFDAAAGHLAAALKKNGVKEEDATALLTIVGTTRKDIVEGKKVGLPVPEPGTKTLWDRLGGEKGVAKVVDEFTGAVAADPKVNFFRDPNYKPTKDQVAKLKKSLVELISSVTGGPLKYTGKSMKEVHKGMKITDAEFDATAKHLEKALKDNNVADDDVKAVMDVVGATRKDIVEKNP